MFVHQQDLLTVNIVDYPLARQLYEETSDAPLPTDALEKAVLDVAMNAFQHANNPNKTQGGIRQALNM